MAAGIDPFSIAAQGLQTVAGIAQSVIGGIKQHKATKAFEKLQTPGYTPNKAIGDYYQTALQRYNTSPYQSAEYNYALQRNRETQATALSALGDRRNSLAGVAGIVNAGNRASAQAGIQAEAERRAGFGALGNATGIKSADDLRAYNQNVLAPYQKKFGLLSQKAAAGGQMLNAGLSNIFGGVSNGAAVAGAQQEAGGTNGANAITNYLPASSVSYNNNYGALERNPLSVNYGAWS